MASDEELEARTAPDIDHQGNQKRFQTGEREVLAIENGEPIVITEPVYEPKQRGLTNQELTELKEQRDRNLSDLEKLAV